MVVARREITQQLVWLARTPGCGDLCSDRFGHHAETHERYGADQERARMVGRPPLVTGILEIDFSQATVTVDGRRITLTGRMWQVMELLALRAGTCVRYEEIVRGVWGDDWLATMSQALQNVSSTVHRLRSILGAAAPLLVTRPAVGLVLLLLPPGDMSGTQNERQAASARWALRYDHCQRCGRNDRSHEGRGYCASCHSAMRKQKP